MGEGEAGLVDVKSKEKSRKKSSTTASDLTSILVYVSWSAAPVCAALKPESQKCATVEMMIGSHSSVFYRSSAATAGIGF
jgi:hypothetical protein